MQKEILFDALTAQEVVARLERLKVLQTEIDTHTTALNAVVLTTGRMSGCAPTDQLGLNAGGTGVVVTPDPETIPSTNVDNEGPGEGKGFKSTDFIAAIESLDKATASKK